MRRSVQGKTHARLLARASPVPTRPVGTRSVAHANRVDGLQGGDGAAHDEEDDLDAGPEEELERLPGDVGSGVERAEFAGFDRGAYTCSTGSQ